MLQNQSWKPTNKKKELKKAVKGVTTYNDFSNSEFITRFIKKQKLTIADSETANLYLIVINKKNIKQHEWLVDITDLQKYNASIRE